jgi:hypothetical protein
LILCLDAAPAKDEEPEAKDESDDVRIIFQIAQLISLFIAGHGLRIVRLNCLGILGSQGLIPSL